MIRILLALIALVGVMWFLSWYKTADKEKRNRAVIGVLLYSVAAALLILVISGRVHWLFALFSAAVPWFNRAMMVGQMWRRFSEAVEQSQPATQESLQAMTEQQALEVLGLEEGASQEEIVAAHKKLMQKIHPDKGGSGYLAAQINQARDILVDV